MTELDSDEAEKSKVTSEQQKQGAASAASAASATSATTEKSQPRKARLIAVDQPDCLKLSYNHTPIHTYT